VVLEIMDEKKAYVELKFGPNWKYISTVRIFIVNFLAITLEDKIRADHIAMAVNELVENAIKYSDQYAIEINLYVYNEGDYITVSVCNYARAEEVEELTRILAEIKSEPPIDAFMKRIMEKSSKSKSKSTIGLARIIYETNANITSSYKDGIVSVHAEFGNEGGKNEQPGH